MLKRFYIFAVVVLFAVVSFPYRIEAGGTSPAVSKIMISEVKLGGPEQQDETKEYVEIFNQTGEEIDLDGWTLQYAKKDFSELECDSSDWSEVSWGYATELDSTLSHNGTLLKPRQLNDDGYGTLRLVDSVGVEHDVVGWGDGAPCIETEATATPSYGKSLRRYHQCDTGYLLDTGNIVNDFLVDADPTPGYIETTYNDDCQNNNEQNSGGEDDDDVGEGDSGDDNGNDNNGDSSQDDQDVISCSPLVEEYVFMTEVLPNPHGVDNGDEAGDGKEFIELHNSGDEDINLEGCSLQINTSRPVGFGDVEIKSGRYMAFYGTDTGITLPNGSGGTVYLLDSEEDELDEVEYPGGLDDDVAWAWFSGEEWQKTYTPTPGDKNIKQPTKPCPDGRYRSEETGRCRSLNVGGPSLKPCREDQFINPVTNRCKLKEDNGLDLKPCSEDQFRNPETNRCKLKESAGSTLKPCDPDQFRNPETNRCKKIDSGNSLKPCDPDQERNPETNRCRKVRGVSSDEDLPKVEDVKAPIVSKNYGWMLAGLAGGGMLAYGVWEWRREILSLFSKIKR